MTRRIQQLVNVFWNLDQLKKKPGIYQIYTPSPLAVALMTTYQLELTLRSCEPPELTKRQIEILKLIGQRMHIFETAESLDINPSTAISRRNAIGDKLEASSTKELVVCAKGRFRVSREELRRGPEP